MALVLPLVLIALMTAPSSAATTPVWTERVKNVCAITVRGQHQTKSFQFQYENLSPVSQNITLSGELHFPNGFVIGLMRTYNTVPASDSLEDSIGIARRGITLYFTVRVMFETNGRLATVYKTGSVVIPPA